MKWNIFLFMIILLGFSACDNKEEGYLVTEHAVYEPDTLVVRKIPDPDEDAIRIEYKTPWISLPMQGYEGTQIILFEVASVSSTVGEDAAALFQQELTIRGGGVLQYPFVNNAPVGRYTVSVRLLNPYGSQVVKNAFTFIIE